MANLTTKRAIVNNNNALDPLSTIDRDDILKAYQDAEAINNETKQFGLNAATTNLLTGTIGYFGGYVPGGTSLPDATIVLTGAVTKYIWLDLDLNAVQSGVALPGGNTFEMMLVPYSGGNWQTPVDIRPKVSTAGGGGGGVVTGMLTPVQIGTGDGVTTDFILPVDSAEELVFADWGVQFRGQQYIRTYAGINPIIQFQPGWVPAVGVEIWAAVSGAVPPTPTYPFRNWYEAQVWRPF